MTFTLKSYVEERVPAYTEDGWHEAARVGLQYDGMIKSSYLTRRWGVCPECRGSRVIHSKRGQEHWCYHCHKDAEGNPTGASEPISEWEVTPHPLNSSG